MRPLAAVLTLVLAACQASPPPALTTAGSGDAAFTSLVAEIIDDTLRRNPGYATYLGEHKYDERLDDLSAAAIAEGVTAAKAFRARLDTIDPATLSAAAQLDREFLQHQMDTRVIESEQVREWARNADLYPSTATDAVFAIMKRQFAPAAERLRRVIAREKQIPALLAQARANLVDPPRVFTQIAIDQNDGVQSFFRTDLPLAFAEVTDPALQRDFKAANDAVITALADYKRWLETDLLPRSTGSFALGASTYTALLSASEMIDTPLDQLLRVAEADLRRNEETLVTAARQLDPARPPNTVLAGITAKHPSPANLLSATQSTLDELRQFVTSRRLATIPPSAPARVLETPPFMAATTSASMDTPGPFEVGADEAYFYMTRPNPRWPAAEQEAYMRQWFDQMILNVAVHEVYPGHYLQFLWAKSYPSDTRKVFGVGSNSEGWAHYTEQMMLEEGFHADDPAYRMAQAQDALLRDVRFIVGIRMHTQGMTVEQAAALFESAAHQPAPVALSEARRGAGDPLYGYYTMGKLAILKLRDDVKRKEGAAFSLQDFHDRFIRLGPLPLPLVRQSLLGERGQLFTF